MSQRSGLLRTTTALALLVLGFAGCGKAPPASAPALPATASAQVADRDVTEHVMTALNQSPVLQGKDIGVVTLKGDVRLSGMLDSQVQIDEALKIARAADGAHAIHDELTIRK